MSNMTTENRMTAAIEQLTLAVENLTYIMAEMNQNLPSFTPVADRQMELTPVELTETEAPQQVAPQQEVISFDDFRAQLMVAAKDPKLGKDKVKEVITRHGGTKAIDIAEDKRQAVLDELA